MTEKVLQEKLVSREVTNEEAYREKAYSFLKKTMVDKNKENIDRFNRNMKLVRVRSYPLLFVSSDIYYEKREIVEKKVPTRKEISKVIPKVDRSVRAAWDIRGMYTQDDFEYHWSDVKLKDATYICNCGTCGGTGGEECTSCKDGYVECKHCKGHGGATCLACGGTGKTKGCDTCGGKGGKVYNERVGWKQVKFGDDYVTEPVYEKRVETCWVCHGTGNADCFYCDGRGWKECSWCEGSGNLECTECEGYGKKMCADCQGCGNILSETYMQHRYAIESEVEKIADYQLDESIYGQNGMPKAVVSKKEEPVLIYEDDEVLDYIPLNKHFPKCFNYSHDVRKAMQRAKDRLEEQGEKVRIVKYRVAVYQREILEICFSFGKKEYYVQWDEVADNYVINKNPYDDFEEDNFTEFQDAYRQWRWKTFLQMYYEYRDLDWNGDKKFKDEVESYFLALKMMVYIVCLGTVVLTEFLMMLPIIKPLWFKGNGESALATIIAFILSWKVAGKYERFANDNGKVTFGILAGICAGITCLSILLIAVLV